MQFTHVAILQNSVISLARTANELSQVKFWHVQAQLGINGIDSSSRRAVKSGLETSCEVLTIPSISPFTPPTTKVLPNLPLWKTSYQTSNSSHTFKVVVENWNVSICPCRNEKLSIYVINLIHANIHDSGMLFRLFVLICSAHTCSPYYVSNILYTLSG